MTKLKTILVDDMPLAIESLKADLMDYHSETIEIVGTANGVLEAAKLIKSKKPNLVFLDIHMGDGDGFDLLEIVNNDNIAVIFTTASREFAIKAFQVSAVDYLLKPIDPELLALAISKLKEPETNNLKNNSDYFISISTQDELRRINIKDIIRLEAMGNYTTFYLKGKEKILVTKTMKEYVSLLGTQFLRVHQSHLVNKLEVLSYIKTEGGYLKMKDQSHVPVSVRKKQDVIKALSE